MRIRSSDPHTLNWPVSLRSKSTVVWAALCLAFTLSPAAATATDLVYHAPADGILGVRDNLLLSGPATTFEGPLFAASPTVRAGLAQSNCAPMISSGPDDPPEIGYLVSEEWDAARGVWVGTYLTSTLRWITIDCRP